jgi:hypothetical protein
MLELTPRAIRAVAYFTSEYATSTQYATAHVGAIDVLRRVRARSTHAARRRLCDAASRQPITADACKCNADSAGVSRLNKFSCALGGVRAAAARHHAERERETQSHAHHQVVAELVQ